jgi:hypothetical protein
MRCSRYDSKWRYVPAKCMFLPWGTLVLDPSKNTMMFVTSVCARGTGAATRVECRRCER